MSQLMIFSQLYVHIVLFHSSVFYIFFFLMIRRPPRSTRTDTLFPYTTLFRSHYDARITPEYGLRPQMPANIPRQFATIDLRDGSTRPATADESSLLEPDSLSGLPGAPKIVGRHGQRAWTQKIGRAHV